MEQQAEYKLPDTSQIKNPKLETAVVLISTASYACKELAKYLNTTEPVILFNTEKEDSVKIANVDIDYLIKVVEYIKLQQNMASDILVLPEEKFNLKY
jgi:type IV secretory pathway VirB6-like protein